MNLHILNEKQIAFLKFLSDKENYPENRWSLLSAAVLRVGVYNNTEGIKLRKLRDEYVGYHLRDKENKKYQIVTIDKSLNNPTKRYLIYSPSGRFVTSNESLAIITDILGKLNRSKHKFNS